MFLGNAISFESPVKSRDSRIASVFGMLFLGFGKNISHFWEIHIVFGKMDCVFGKT